MGPAEATGSGVVFDELPVPTVRGKGPDKHGLIALRDLAAGAAQAGLVAVLRLSADIIARVLPPCLVSVAAWIIACR